MSFGVRNIQEHPPFQHAHKHMPLQVDDKGDGDHGQTTDRRASAASCSCRSVLMRLPRVIHCPLIQIANKSIEHYGSFFAESHARRLISYRDSQLVQSNNKLASPRSTPARHSLYPPYPVSFSNGTSSSCRHVRHVRRVGLQMHLFSCATIAARFVLTVRPHLNSHAYAVTLRGIFYA